MQVTVELSLYPLTEDYTSVIIDFIQGLKKDNRFLIRTSAMSTYIVGEYDDVMSLLSIELKKVYQHIPDSSTVIKIIPKKLNIEGGWLDF